MPRTQFDRQHRSQFHRNFRLRVFKQLRVSVKRVHLSVDRQNIPRAVNYRASGHKRLRFESLLLLGLFAQRRSSLSPANKTNSQPAPAPPASTPPTRPINGTCWVLNAPPAAPSDSRLLWRAAETAVRSWFGLFSPPSAIARLFWRLKFGDL